MCWSCFKVYTDEPVVNDRVLAAYRRIAERPGESDISPLLHVIVGDMNLEDEHFDLKEVEVREVYEGSSEWEQAIFDELASLSEPERATAVAMEWGYILPTGELREEAR